MNFVENYIINSLTKFFQNYNCDVYTSYDYPMGAATFHPDVIFFIKGIHKNSVLCTQLCRRPLDGILSSSIRMSLFHQFQVVIPYCSDACNIFIKSLSDISLLSKHEPMFINSMWESPSLGASGFGWEVRIAGVEVCQITYFDTFANKKLDNIVLEFAYGIERLSYVYNYMNYSTKLYSYRHDDYDVSNVLILLNKYVEICYAFVKVNNFLLAYDNFLMVNYYFNILDALSAFDNIGKINYLNRIRACFISIYSIKSLKN